MSSDIKKKIVKHAKEPHQLRAALDHIDIVLGFLAASSGVRPLTTLKEYARNMLEIEDFDESVCQMHYSKVIACKMYDCIRSVNGVVSNMCCHYGRQYLWSWPNNLLSMAR